MAKEVYRVVIMTNVLCGFCTNGFICGAFVRCRKLRTVTNYFVVNLAVAGLISFLVMTLWELMYFVPEPPGELYLFLQSMDVFAGSLSPASVAAIAFDRYFAVSRPLRYSSYVTHNKAVGSLLGVWLYALIIALLTWFRKLDATNEFTQIYAILMTLYNVVVVLIFCFFCYISILQYAWPHLKQNPALRHCAQASRGFVLAKHLKITFTIVLLSAPVLFGWAAFYIITTVEGITGSQFLGPTGEFIVSILPNIIAALNPIIYIVLTKDLRGVARKLLCCRNQAREDRLTSLQFLPQVSGAASAQTPSPDVRDDRRTMEPASGEEYRPHKKTEDTYKQEAN